METLLRFIPVNLDTLTRVRESTRHFLNANVAAGQAEKTVEQSVLASVLAKPPSVKVAFTSKRKKAANWVSDGPTGFWVWTTPIPD
jgi:hypothetical protein